MTSVTCHPRSHQKTYSRTPASNFSKIDLWIDFWMFSANMFGSTSKPHLKLTNPRNRSPHLNNFQLLGVELLMCSLSQEPEWLFYVRCAWEELCVNDQLHLSHRFASGACPRSCILRWPPSLVDVPRRSTLQAPTPAGPPLPVPVFFIVKTCWFLAGITYKPLKKMALNSPLYIYTCCLIGILITRIVS